MRFRRQQKDHVSVIDQLFDEWDQSLPVSASQQAEIAKYQRIAQQRDHAGPSRLDLTDHKDSLFD